MMFWMLLLMLATAPAHAETAFDLKLLGDGFNYQTPGEPWSITAVEEPRRAGSVAGRVELRQGEDYCNAESCRGRAELADPERRPLNTSVWYRVSLLLDPATGCIGDWQIVTQWHVRPAGDDPEASPPLSFSCRGTKLELQLNHGSRSSPHKHILKTIPLARGCWHDFLVNLKVAPWSGFVQVWRQGVRVLTYNGKVGYDGDSTEINHKAGIYRSRVSTAETVVIHVDELGSALSSGGLAPLPVVPSAGALCPL
jgi:hypothetical protein